MAGPGVSFNTLETAQAAMQIADIQFACVMCGIAHRTDRQAWKACHARLCQMLDSDPPVYAFPDLRRRFDDITCFPWQLISHPDLFTEWQSTVRSLQTYAEASRPVMPQCRSQNNGNLFCLPWLALTYPAFYRELEARRLEAARLAADDAQHGQANVTYLTTRLQELCALAGPSASRKVVNLTFDRVAGYETAAVVECGSDKQRTRRFKSNAVKVTGRLPSGQECRAIIPEGDIVARIADDLPFMPSSCAQQYDRAAIECAMDVYPLSYKYGTLEHIAVVRNGLYLAVKEAGYAYLYPKSYPIRRQVYHAVLIRDFVAPEYMGALKSCASARSYASAKKRAVPLEELQGRTLLDGWPPPSAVEKQ